MRTLMTLCLVFCGLVFVGCGGLFVIGLSVAPAAKSKQTAKAQPSKSKTTTTAASSPTTSAPEPKPKKTIDPKSSKIKLECQSDAKKEVSKYLKNAHTANFPFGAQSATYSHYPDLAPPLNMPRWTIAGHVDSRNDFNASKRTTYEVCYYVDTEANSYGVLTISLNGKMVARSKKLAELSKE